MKPEIRERKPGPWANHYKRPYWEDWGIAVCAGLALVCLLLFLQLYKHNSPPPFNSNYPAARHDY